MSDEGLLNITGPPPPQSLNGRVAIITGGSSGIGLATAQLLLDLGCRVAIADLAPPPPGSFSESSKVHFTKTDVTSYPSLLAAFRAARNVFGSYPDIVFANAGIGEKGDIFSGPQTEADIESEPDHSVLRIDLEGVANTARIGWWGIKQNKIAGKASPVGSIILTASFAGYQGQPGLSMYNSAKHGVVGLARGLRYSAPSDGIAVSLVAPAITPTPLIAPGGDYKTTASNYEKAGVPLNSVRRIAEVVAFLAAKGKAANGMGIFVQGDLCTDLEKGIARSRNSWMSKPMAEMYKGGKSASPFTNMSVASEKSKL